MPGSLHKLPYFFISPEVFLLASVMMEHFFGVPHEFGSREENWITEGHHIIDFDLSRDPQEILYHAMDRGCLHGGQALHRDGGQARRHTIRMKNTI